MGKGTRDGGIIFGGDGRGEGSTMSFCFEDWWVTERKKRKLMEKSSS